MANSLCYLSTTLTALKCVYISTLNMNKYAIDSTSNVLPTGHDFVLEVGEPHLGVCPGEDQRAGGKD